MIAVVVVAVAQGRPGALPQARLTLGRSWHDCLTALASRSSRLATGPRLSQVGLAGVGDKVKD
jgi:hypothetical protein